MQNVQKNKYCISKMQCYSHHFVLKGYPTAASINNISAAKTTRNAEVYLSVLIHQHLAEACFFIKKKKSFLLLFSVPSAVELHRPVTENINTLFLVGPKKFFFIIWKITCICREKSQGALL